MKKLFLSLMALAALAVGCQQDNPGLDYDGKDSVPYTISVAVPELAATRANETEMNSGLGAIDNFSADEWAAYDLRYILEVYDVDRSLDEPIKAREIKTVDEYSEITFETRLIPNRNYRFVVWADFVDQGTQADLHYDTGEYLTAITRNEVVAMDECQDAYFIQEDVRIDGTGISKELELKRPFGKIRVITTDYNEVNFGSEPAWVNVTFYNHAIYQSLNAVTGEASGNTLESYTYSYDVSKRTPYTEGYDSDEKNMTLFADYILAGNAGAQEVNFTIEVYGADKRPINSHDFNTQIPLERNYLTTIVGNLLTVQNDITVFVDDDFDGEYLRKYEDEAIALEEGAFNVGEINNNGNYTFVVNDGTYNFNIIVPQSAVGSNGELIAAEAEFVASQDLLDYNKFTVEGLKVDATRGAFVDAYIVGGSLNILDTTAGSEVILDLEYTLDYNVEVPVYQMIYFTYVGDVVAKTFLATPELKASVDGNAVTLSWGDVEGASSYAVTCGTEMPVFVEGNTYTFFGEYDTEYRFHVVAMPEDEDKHYASEPAELFITTHAAAKELEIIDYYVSYYMGGDRDYTFTTKDLNQFILSFRTVECNDKGVSLMVENTEENPYYTLKTTDGGATQYDINYPYSQFVPYGSDYSYYFDVAEVKVTELEKGNFKFEGQFKVDNDNDPVNYTFTFTEPEPSTITVYVDENMPELYFYSWIENVLEITAGWPGDLMTSTGKPGEFAYTYAPEYSGLFVNLIFNNGQGGTGNQTEDITDVPLNGDKYFECYGIAVPEVAPDAPTTESVIYFTAPEWEVDGARFAVWYWNNSSQNFADLTLAEGEKQIYTVTIPAGYSNIIFTRMPGDNMENNWDNKWNQTENLTIPTDGTNLFTINDPWAGNGQAATGTWSVYTPSPVTPEVNYITSMSTGSYNEYYYFYTFKAEGENFSFNLLVNEYQAQNNKILAGSYKYAPGKSYAGNKNYFYVDSFKFDGVTYKASEASTMVVEGDGTNVVITMDLTMDSGDKFTVMYNGKIGGSSNDGGSTEITKLATPSVSSFVTGNAASLSWNEIAGAKDYTVTLNGTDVKTVTTAYIDYKDLDWETTYSVSVVANPADSAVNSASDAGTTTFTTEANPNGGNEGGEWIGREVKLQLLAYQENSLLYTKVNNESKYFMTTFRNGIVAGKFVLAGDNKSEEIMTAGHAASQYGLFGGTTLFADGDTVEVIDNGGGSYTIIYRVTVNGENLTATYSGTL